MKYPYKVILSQPGVYVPPRTCENPEEDPNILTNKDLEDMAQIDTNVEWILDRTGFREGRISHYKNSREMLVEATKDLFDKTGWNINQIGKMGVALNRHDDEQGFPQHAGYVAHALGRPSKIAWFDGPFMGCVGGIGAIIQADDALMNPRNHFTKVLAGVVERLSGMTNFYDRNTCILFGDAAVAYGLERVCASDPREGIINTYSSGTFDTKRVLALEKGLGLRIRPRDMEEHPGDNARFKFYTHKFKFEEVWQNYLNMPDGPAILKFAVRAMRRAVHNVLLGTPYDLRDIDVIIPHSANKRIIDPAMDALMSKENPAFIGKIVTCYEEYRNTSSTSLGIAEDKARKQGIIKPGSLVIQVAFGAGLQEGALLYRAT